MHKSKLQLLMADTMVVWLMEHIHNALNNPEHFLHFSELSATRTLHELSIVYPKYGFPFTESMLNVKKPNESYGRALIEVVKLPENKDSVEFFGIFKQAIRQLDEIAITIPELSELLAQSEYKSNVFGQTLSVKLNNEEEIDRLSKVIENSRKTLEELEAQADTLMRKHHPIV